jgi:MFS transporter, DHA2 family, multidrug resistance protein
VYSLVRNIGGSVGISIVQALLTRGTAQAHEQLATLVAPGNRALSQLPDMLSPGNPAGLAVLNAEVTRQAALISYINDFTVMMFVTVLTIPLLLIVKRPGRRAGATAAAADAAH